MAQITLAPADTTLTAVNDFFQLTATAVDAGGNPLSPNLEWQSSDSTVVTVDNVGLVVAVGEGLAAVTARADTVFGSAQITVDLSASAVDSVHVAPDSLSFDALAQSQVLTAQAFTATGDSVDVTFGWATRDADVATVDPAGLVTSVSAGTTFVVATANGISDSAWVAVTALPPGALRSWTNPAGGSWQQASNWSDGLVPAAGDTVRIDAAGAYTVTIDGSVTVARLELGGTGASPRLETNGNPFRPGEGFVAAGAELALEALPEPRRGLGGLEVDGELRIDGTLTWLGGPIEGDGSLFVSPSGEVNAGGAPVLALEVACENQGTFRLGSDVQLQLRAAFDNATGALLDFTSDSIIFPSGSATLSNAGTVRKSGGTFDSQIGVGVGSWLSTGTIDVQTGTLQAYNGEFGGTLAIAAGSVLDLSSSIAFRNDVTLPGDGELEVAGQLTVGTQPGGPITVPRLRFTTGTIGGPADLVVSEELTWRAGTFAGSGAVTVAVGATATTSGSGFKALSGTAFTNAGTFLAASPQVLTVSEGASITNALGALWSVEDASDVEAGSGSLGSFLNLGTYRMASPQDGLEMEIDFTNEGTLDLRSGRFEPVAAFVHAAGALLSGGGTSGALNGNIRLDLTNAATITLAGKIAPDSAGTFARLDVLGAAALAASAEIEVEAHGEAPFLVEQVKFVHDVTLDGTLSVVRTFTPESEDAFYAVRWPVGSSGAFATVNPAGFVASQEPQGLLLTWP